MLQKELKRLLCLVFRAINVCVRITKQRKDGKKWMQHSEQKSETQKQAKSGY